MPTIGYLMHRDEYMAKTVMTVPYWVDPALYHCCAWLQAENWITVEEVELHSIVKKKEYNESGVISFVPLDGSKFEFMRFRYR